MKSYFGTIRFASGKEEKATVLLFDKVISIGYQNEQSLPETIKWPITKIEAVADFPSQNTRIRLTDTQLPELAVADKDIFTAIQALQQEHAQPWFRKTKAKEWRRNMLIFLAIVSLFVLLYFLLVPWLSEKMANKVSVSTEERLGETVYNALGVAPQENREATVMMNQFFTAMNVQTPYTIRISVVNDATVNAFALPGGRIVVYTALLKNVKSYPALAALLAHEFTHINNKHATKTIFRSLGSKIFIGLLFGRFGTVASVLADKADDLKSLKYSRSLEKEADMNGLDLLLARQIDPKGFEDLFKNLKNSGQSTVVPELLGSHPDIDKRIAYINNAVHKPVIEENSELKTIFDNIKKQIQ